MAFIHNVSTVAKYEAKTLRRSWFFRLFSLGAIFIFTFLNLGLFSPVGDESWDLISIPSTLPLINLYLLNIAQAIVVIFLAADFLKRDKKVDTNEVLYTRSMSNFEYIIGKTWGILRLFIGLDIVIMSIGLLFNIISRNMSIDYFSYIAYLLIICVPTIVFSLGLAFVIMSLLRNQAITFLVLLGIAALNMFYLWYRMGFIFDYMAFGLPIFKSGMIGFDNLSLIINQRLLYFFAGMALVLTTVLLFNRLPQSRFHRILTIVFLIIFTLSAGFCGFKTYSFYSDEVSGKQLVIETNKKFEDKKFVSVTHTSIDMEHKDESFRATAGIRFKNDNREPVDRYIFSLNPALNVLKVTAGGTDLKFAKTNHIIEIEPATMLNSGGSDSISISYEGSINEPFCYPNYNEKFTVMPYRIAMLNINKRQAFLEKDFMLLTPETHWYPVAALNYYPSNPARIKIDFTRFTLRIKEEEGLLAISQGHKKSSEGYSTFTPESPLTGITIAVGNYHSDTLRVDSIDYISYCFPDHDYYKKDLAELKDTLPNLVSGIMRELETNFATKYPFKTLSLVEVPVQFYSLPRQSTQTRSELQPSMVLLPEKLSTVENAGFNKQFTRQKKRMERNNQVITDKELQLRIFNTFIRNTFISGENFTIINGQAANEPTRYRLGPSFYFFKNNFYSSEYPVINAIFESNLQQIRQIGPRGGYQNQGAVSDNDKANIILRNTSFRDLLKENPLGDTVRNVLMVKGDWLFNLFRSKAGIEEFNTWFSGYIDENKFMNVDILKFNEDVNKKFGFEFYPYLENWFNGKAQPGFLFSEMKANQIVINDRSRYQVTFNVSNPEPVAGLFNVSFRTGGPGGRGGSQMNFQGGGGQGSREGIAMQGRGMEAADISKIVFLDSMESKKVGILLDFQPRSMMINTLFSRNIPGQITKPIDEVIKSGINAKPFDGEEALATSPLAIDPSDIIVDNEDTGFTSSVQSNPSPLKQLFGIKNNTGQDYQQIRQYNRPEYWQQIVQSSYYGKYVLSSVYTRAGIGDKKISWSTIIKEPGYYNVYCYIGKMQDRMNARRGVAGVPGGQPASGGQPGGREENLFKDMHYKIHHDAGIEEITLDYENAEGGWNNMGSYYFSPDTAKVELTNLTGGEAVIGDAIRWEKQK